MAGIFISVVFVSPTEQLDAATVEERRPLLDAAPNQGYSWGAFLGCPLDCHLTPVGPSFPSLPRPVQPTRTRDYDPSIPHGPFQIRTLTPLETISKGGCFFFRPASPDFPFPGLFGIRQVTLRNSFEPFTGREEEKEIKKTENNNTTT